MSEVAQTPLSGLRLLVSDRRGFTALRQAQDPERSRGGERPDAVNGRRGPAVAAGTWPQGANGGVAIKRDTRRAGQLISDSRGFIGGQPHAVDGQSAPLLPYGRAHARVTLGNSTRPNPQAASPDPAGLGSGECIRQHRCSPSQCEGRVRRSVPATVLPFRPGSTAPRSSS